jgi:diguanylate cyclase (GGDEF)-like protein
MVASPPPSKRPEPREGSAAADSESSAVPAAWQDLLDHLECGIAAYDADDRLTVFNEHFRKLYGPLADAITPGRSFEELLRIAVERGLIPEAEGRAESWIQERLSEHRAARGPLLRRMADGSWRSIIESRLSNGGLLSFSVDVSEQVRKTEALQAALDAAQLARDRLEDAVEALPAGFELWDAEDRLVLSNAELRNLYGAIGELFVPGARWEDLVRANQARGGLDVASDALDAYIAVRRVARRHPGEASYHATPEGRWLRSFERRSRDGGLVAVRVDITEMRNQRTAAEQARRQAEAANRRLHDAIESLPDGFALFDADDRLVICNEPYRRLYADSIEAIRVGARFEDILRFGLDRGQYPQALGREDEWLAQRLQQHRHPGEPQLQQLSGNRWVRIDERKTSDGGLAGIRSDVTELIRRGQELEALNRELAQARAQLEELSETDGLTGVANRRQFDRRLAEEWSRHTRHGTPLTLALLDVDHFKHYNDHYGHPAGDACLRQVARLIADCAQRPTDLVARYGGEEFAVLMPHTGGEAASVQAMRFLAAISEARMPHAGAPTAPIVTASLGAVHTEGQAFASAEALVQAADRALYRAKAGGRNRAEMG